MARFIHTSDWQLGMPRRFLEPEAQACYSQARIDMIKSIGKLARAESCDFVVVAGDVFEYEQMDRRTVAKALGAMGEAGVPIILLPGNHDPYHDDSVYKSKQFESGKPSNVIVLADSAPVAVAEGVEVVGAPWHSKHPAGNPVIKALDSLQPVSGTVRICLAHGYVDVRSFSDDDEAVIPTSLLEQAIADGKIHYVALGDKHSCDSIGASGRIRYSGTPEQADFDEEKPGRVCLVEISPDGIVVEERRIGTWKFPWLKRQVTSADDVAAIARELESMPDKDVTVVRLDISGSLGLAENQAFHEQLDELRLHFAGIVLREIEFMVHAGDVSRLCRHLAGYAAEAADELRAMIAEGGKQAETAGDALLLLARLAPGVED